MSIAALPIARHLLLICVSLLVACAAPAHTAVAQVLRLHPENPHYFEFRGQPTVLVTSAEHYGAVLNVDFDFETYLETLAGDGLNYTRIFTGSYVEVPGSFNIGSNTLAPAAGKFLSPWMPTKKPGALKGETKWDLEKFNPKYFERLKNFVGLASEKGIVVEVTLFCSSYADSNWQRSPLNPKNNVNDFPDGLERKQPNIPHDDTVLAIQDALVKKIVTELNAYDNIFYEIQNEPWADHPQKAMRILKTLEPKPQGGDWYKWAETASPDSLRWQAHIANLIEATEQQLPKQHLIAQNYCNFKASLPAVADNISILNFHYAWPAAVHLNYAWNRPICFDESGFAGSDDETYLRQAWQFMLAGGAMFNNLDYSFSVGHEKGDGQNNAPGGGSPELRKQLKFLLKFLRSLDFVHMHPDVTTVFHAPGLETFGISQYAKQYAFCLSGRSGGTMTLSLPAGKYNYQFVSPAGGKLVREGEFEAAGAPAVIDVPTETELLGLKITTIN